jgi:hypothetical protein
MRSTAGVFVEESVARGVAIFSFSEDEVDKSSKALNRFLGGMRALPFLAVGYG